MASDQLVRRFGLGGNVSGIAAGGVVALVLFPLQQRLESWAKRTLPATDDEREAAGERATS